MGSKPTEAAVHDADVFLERMRKAVSAFGPARVRELACEIAQRYVGALGEDAGSARAMIQEAHTLAAIQPISQAQFEEWAGILNEMSANVDPDRMGAPDAWRALSMIKLALRACTEGPPAGAGPFDVVCASLVVRALRQPPANEAEQQSMREALRERWSWQAVHEEKRWLAAYVESGVKLAPEPLTTKAPEPPTAKAPAPPAARPAAPPATKPPVPPATKAPEPRVADREPRVFTLPLAGHALQFIGVDGDPRFRVMVDGRHCLVRERRVSVRVSEGGSSGNDPPPAWTEATMADLTDLLRALDEGARPAQERNRTVLTWHEPGAHFRQNDWTTVTISLAPDGVVELETKLEWQDDSFY
jgi:hypothetical protein